MARSTAGLVAGGLLGATVLVLAGCGTDRGGSVALGDAAPAPALTTASGGGVVFVPLDSPTPGGTTASGAQGTQETPGAPGATAAPSTGPGAGSATGSGSGGAGGGSGGGPHGGGQPGTPGKGSGGGTTTGGTSQGTGGTPTGTGSPTPGAGAPQTPASLTATALRTADTGRRWCQQVTLTLVNSGDRAATGGTVTFATHVIGALGIDWWTYRTSQPLAAPVAGHTSTDENWTVCLDSWRVPAGMHLETRSATLG